MIRLKLKGIESEFEIFPGAFHDVAVENPLYLYACLRSLYSENGDFITLTDNYEDIPISKNVLFIKNLFDLNPNSKKILSLLYKQASKAYLNADRREKINRIQDEINELLDEISLDFNYPMTFERTMCIDKIMQNSSFSFAYEEQTSFIASFLTYLRVIQEFSMAKVIITTNVTFLLSKTELDELKQELMLMGLALLNISFSGKPTKSTVVFDYDYCEL